MTGRGHVMTFVMTPVLCAGDVRPGSGGHTCEQRRHRDGAEVPGLSRLPRRQDHAGQHPLPLLGTCTVPVAV